MFWKAPLVSEDLQDWIYACFDWFDARFEPPDGPILPTRAFFDLPRGRDEATARLALDAVARHMGYQGRVETAPLDVLPAELRLDYNALSAVAGTHEHDGAASVIRYDPAVLEQPVQFINLLAHELMHARLAGLEDEVPGGAGAHELATDLGCIIAGFGVFQLRAAEEAGWFGYMTQESRAFALAVFLERRGLGAEAVAEFLLPRSRKLLKRAEKGLRKVQ